MDHVAAGVSHRDPGLSYGRVWLREAVRRFRGLSHTETVRTRVYNLQHNYNMQTYSLFKHRHALWPW
jgi:hypothetical protein